MPDPIPAITFAPILKRIIWGGRRLGERLGKPIGAEADYAESWELVDRSADQSTVVNGPFAEMTIAQLLRTHSQEIMGRHGEIANFPLLLKYLDCNRVLSVQVHPADDYALKMAKPDLGKTEAWYVVEAGPESVIYAGLKEGVDRSALADAVASGKTESVLHSFKPISGQCVFIPAGTVHALGGGLLIAEVQQSSDTTFRLFDWNRLDSTGKSRELHIEQSLAVTDFQRGPVHPQTPQACVGGWETLVSCEKFAIRRAQSSSTTTFLTGGDDAPVVLMITNGRLVIDGKHCPPQTFGEGQTVLLPANFGEAKIHCEGTDVNLLEICLP